MTEILYRLAIYRISANDTRPGYDHTDVFTSQRFYLCKSAILECIQITSVGFS